MTVTSVFNTHSLMKWVRRLVLELMETGEAAKIYLKEVTVKVVMQKAKVKVIRALLSCCHHFHRLHDDHHCHFPESGLCCLTSLLHQFPHEPSHPLPQLSHGE